jgi:hypothetical protein
MLDCIDQTFHVLPTPVDILLDIHEGANSLYLTCPS